MGSPQRQSTGIDRGAGPGRTADGHVVDARVVLAVEPQVGTAIRAAVGLDMVIRACRQGIAHLTSGSDRPLACTTRVYIRPKRQRNIPASRDQSLVSALVVSPSECREVALCEPTQHGTGGRRGGGLAHGGGGGGGGGLFLGGAGAARSRQDLSQDRARGFQTWATTFPRGLGLASLTGQSPAAPGSGFALSGQHVVPPLLLVVQAGGAHRQQGWSLRRSTSQTQPDASVLSSVAARGLRNGKAMQLRMLQSGRPGDPEGGVRTALVEVGPGVIALTVLARGTASTVARSTRCRICWTCAAPCRRIVCEVGGRGAHVACAVTSNALVS